MEDNVNLAKSTEFKGEESKNESSILEIESCVTMEANVIFAKNTKGEEPKRVNKKEAAVVDSGECKIAITPATTESSPQKKSKKKKKKKNDSNRILVSHTKKPFVFYLSLAKRYIKQYNHIELAGLGLAIPTVVSIAEALKRDGLASHKEIKISTLNSKEDKGHFIQKAKIQIVLGKGEKFDNTIIATTAPKMAADERF